MLKDCLLISTSFFLINATEKLIEPPRFVLSPLFTAPLFKQLFFLKKFLISLLEEKWNKCF